MHNEDVPRVLLSPYSGALPDKTIVMEGLVNLGPGDQPDKSKTFEETSKSVNDISLEGDSIVPSTKVMVGGPSGRPLHQFVGVYNNY